MTPDAMALASALQVATEYANQRGERKHIEKLTKLKSTALAHMVDAVVTRRVDAIEKQCHTVLAMYAEQARSYIEEKKSYTDKILGTTDLILRTELLSRTNAIDTKLAEVRADAQMVFSRMGELLLAVGGTNLDFARDLTAPLVLSNRR